MFSLIVPPMVTKHPFVMPLKKDKPIIFWPSPKPGTKVIFQIMRTDKSFTEDKINRLSGLASRPFTIVGYLPMATGLVWLLHRIEEFTAAEQAAVEDVFRKLKVHITPANASLPSWAFAWLFEEDSKMAWATEIELGEENVERKG
jgi:hypothetical protein